ncbi:MAG: MvaI/BcnI family restriction endonuclease [Oscillospiraceae bacterium]|jgi:hypothetical protein|nr:MvaI/BcnI family restriction endonuclease [Oscillospiraceae bacterium]
MREDDLLKLRDKLAEIKNMGWIENRRPGNAGGVGNTLEDLLEVAENNLQLPDFGEWELKSQRGDSGALLTLFHVEPEPRKARIVPKILLPLYGWAHQKAGTLHCETERRFSLTINAKSYSNRGFKVNVDRECKCIYISFDYFKIDSELKEWREFIQSGVGTADINPNPYWSFDTITKKLKEKLNNLLYFRAERKIENGIEHFKYNTFEAYIDPDLEKFLRLVEQGAIYVDFDARTGHNHGTKFRIKPDKKVELYNSQLEV